VTRRTGAGAPPQCGQSHAHSGLDSEAAGVVERVKVSSNRRQSGKSSRRRRLASVVSEEAAEADAHKAARQGVEQEPPQKFAPARVQQVRLSEVAAGQSGSGLSPGRTLAEGLVLTPAAACHVLHEISRAEDPR
jgi:hypothetical protein